MKTTPGKTFRALVKSEKPLQLAGTINAYSAILAKDAGFKAIYLSGAGVANASFGLPDLGMTTLNDVCEDVRRITSVVDLPLLVDADTGFGGVLNIPRTINDLSNAGAAACHLEDQILTKRCGHRPNKVLVSCEEMCDKIRIAADSRNDDSFVIMARTDALAVEGLESALERAAAYAEAGADMVFAEAVTKLDEYRNFCSNINKPILANITEFGKTPYFTAKELYEAGVSMVLYPLSAFRAMSKTALEVYKTIINEGTQSKCLNKMQTRDELYEKLNYHEFERRIDDINS